MMRGGIPQMGGNMNNLIKQAQKLQKQLEDMRVELEQKTVEASSGGGAVVAVANGKKQIVDIKIKQEVVDPDDVEMLQDLVLAAVNEALNKAEEMMATEMGKITGGLNIPGLF
ncbi:YbaB/EbfC family nucleoid-associated protein [Caloramator sp. E03]|uniref:YbaB/EbfC family nucleoid-associated protein n=1 Tax=Caloramator sp. E03 TaxID=2576307 RepID=UPI00111061A6|nr:YbaB/EbfC family nucleoid-associated protein [Caloramator sp. E03]QCX33492.1 YbaB/EbfC family nucleoid-associated protein [Caloramator sp. E03]